MTKGPEPTGTRPSGLVGDSLTEQDVRYRRILVIVRKDGEIYHEGPRA
jgi:hypothetical protein